MDNSPNLLDAQAREYNRIQRRLTIADALLGLAMLFVILATGWTIDLRDVAFHIAGSQNYITALFIYVAILTLLSRALGFGLDFYAFRLEHRFRLSNQRLRAWLWDEVKGYLVGLAVATILTQVLYMFIRNDRASWWIAAWIAFLVLYIVFAQLAPVVLFPIFYKFHTLQNDSLRERLTRLSESAGTKVRGVYEWSLSEKSKKANAALMGLGSTRRIVISDTLLQNYSDDEIEAVLAHELGHHVHRHIFQSIAMQAVFSFIGFWVIKTAIRHYSPAPVQADFANLPLIVLVMTVLSLVLLPIMNAFSRYNERQADRYAWKSLANTAPFVSAMNKLAEQNLSEREPSRIVEIFFHSHPPISKRIAAAEAWKSTD